MKSYHMLALTMVVLIRCSTLAFAQDNLLGHWRDSAPSGDSISFLEISNDSIAVGRKVTYKVKSAGAFGGGQLFEVTGLNRKQDPEGCGPSGKVRYVAAQPLDPIAPGVGGPAIRVFFYSGESPPTIESITNDIALCSIHPFNR